MIFRAKKNPERTRHVSCNSFGEGASKTWQCSAPLAKAYPTASWHLLTSSGHLGQGGGGSIFCSLIPGLFISPEAGLVSFQRKRQKNSNQCVRLSIEGLELYNSAQSLHPRKDVDRGAGFSKIPRHAFNPEALASSLRISTYWDIYRAHAILLDGAHLRSSCIQVNNCRFICLSLVPTELTPKSGSW